MSVLRKVAGPSVECPGVFPSKTVFQSVRSVPIAIMRRYIYRFFLRDEIGYKEPKGRNIFCKEGSKRTFKL